MFFDKYIINLMRIYLPDCLTILLIYDVVVQHLTLQKVLLKLKLLITFQ
jgi:hypothetical protein